jgi:hypothetical protein
MLAILHLLATFIAALRKPPHRLEVENVFLRHQLNIALRRAPHRPRLCGSDRALIALTTWLWPSLLGLSRIVRPDTILRWHRAGFRAYWRRRSRGRPGRPRVHRELRELIRRMSNENPLWGAPRVHGELLKLGFKVAESTVSKYISRRRRPPSQSWQTFLRNYAAADSIAEPMTGSAAINPLEQPVRMREKRDHQTSDRDKPKERISVQQRTRLWRLPCRALRGCLN